MLAGLLAGTEPDRSVDWPAIWTEAAAHRVHLLLARRVLDGRGPDCPVEWRTEMARVLREAALIEAARARDLRQLLERLAARDVPAVVFKGTALAYGTYPSPELRPRVDVDLFIPEDRVNVVREVMRDAGYRHDPTVGGRLVVPQHHYEKSSAFGLSLVDVHWRLANVGVFAEAMAFGELFEHAVPAPSLGPRVRVPSNVHALFIACLHRVAHHHDAGDLIWLYDIHLLAGSLSDADWRRFIALVSERGMRTVCAHSLAAARTALHTPMAEGIARELTAVTGEPSAAFLTGGRRRSTLELELENLRRLSNWRSRLAMVREHLFPPAEYMLAKYRRRGRGWLPALYAHRMLTGGARWLTDRP